MIRALTAVRGRLTMTGAMGAAIVLVILLVIYAIVQPSLLSTTEINSLANEATVVAIAAVGETIVVLAGGFDLSVGSVLSLLNVLIATRIGDGIGSELLMIPFALAVGMGTGLVNGILVAFLRIPSIVTTLAMSFFWSGVALLVLSQPGGSVPIDFVNWFTASIGDVVPNALVLIIGVALLWLVFKRTTLGRAIYAIGGDQEAAAANGISVRRTTLAAYVAAGFFYGIAGLFLTGESASGDPNIGTPLLLAVFAAVVVGGTAFGGGRGDAIGSLIGAFILSVIANVLFAMGVSAFYTNIFNGAVLLLAVLAGTIARAVGRLTGRAWRRSPTGLGPGGGRPAAGTVTPGA